MRRLPVVTLAAFAFLALAGPSAADPTEPLVDALVSFGFENVVARATADGLTLWYENRVLRYEMTAMGVVAAIALDTAHPVETLTLVPMNLGLPILATAAPASAWRRLLTGELHADDFRDALRVAEPGPPPPGRGRHRSTWKLDVGVRPLVAFELGRPDDVFQWSFALAPEAVLSPYPGSLLTGQVVVRLRQDLNPTARKVSPGRNTVTVAGRLPAAVLGSASGGILPGERYGFVGEGSRFLLGGHLELTAGGELTGRLEFDEDATLYSGLDSWSAFGALTARPHGPDLEVRGLAARFLEEDLGVRLDLARRIHETRLAFFGIKTESRSVGGVRIDFPLPVRRQLRPSRVRPITIPSFPIEYRDTLGNIGRQTRHFNDTVWVRKGLSPTFVRNNVDDLRWSRHYREVTR